VAYHKDTRLALQFEKITDKFEWILKDGIMPQAFNCLKKGGKVNTFNLSDDISEVSDNFNKGRRESPFKNSGVMANGKVYSLDTLPTYDSPYLTLGDVVIDETDVPEEFFISREDLPKWEYQKGSKSLKRINKSTGYEYNYSEGAMAFPDYLDRPSRTIITGEGGAGPSRFKHVIKTESGRYRRLVPIELERLNMFPDNHTFGSSNLRRAFLMGNALVTGIVENIALILKDRI
ncbi:MAG: DNA cytosine methyltransferase, partial [Hoylesella buccalis]